METKPVQFNPKIVLRVSDLLDTQKLEGFLDSVKVYRPFGRRSEPPQPQLQGSGYGESLPASIAGDEVQLLRDLRIKALGYLMLHPDGGVRKRALISYLKFLKNEPESVPDLDVFEADNDLLNRMVTVVKGPLRYACERLLLNLFTLCSSGTYKGKIQRSWLVELYGRLIGASETGFMGGAYTQGDLQRLRRFIMVGTFSEKLGLQLARCLLSLMKEEMHRPIFGGCLLRVLSVFESSSGRLSAEHLAQLVCLDETLIKRVFSAYYGFEKTHMSLEMARCLVLLEPMGVELLEYCDYYKGKSFVARMLSYLEAEFDSEVLEESPCQRVLQEIASNYCISSRRMIARHKGLSWRVFDQLIERGLPLFTLDAIRRVNTELYLNSQPDSVIAQTKEHLQRFAKNAPAIGEEIRAKGLL